MADLPGDFWGGWITVITVLSLIGLSWLTWSVYFSKDTEDSHESPVWDENLKEGSRPAPLWWFWLILALLVFSVGYLMLYPGLGSFKGVMKWSQGGRLEHSYEQYEQEFSEARNALLNASYETLQSDPEAMRAARGLFSRNCAACHGPEGAGQASQFPDLTSGAWQWGGSVEQIEQTIRHGRVAAMPPWIAALGEDGVKEVATYVQSMSKIAGDSHPGKIKYQQFCVSCHGVNGEGNPLLGAPNLADEVWLYGNSLSEISTSITLGRNGVMPAFGARLDDVQIRLLTAWLTRQRENQATH